MGSRIIKQVPVTFSGAGSKFPANIALAGNLRELYLQLSYTLTCTAANNTRANMFPGDEWAAIQRIDIVANSSDVLMTFTGDELWWYNRKWFNVMPPLPIGMGDATTANPIVNSCLVLPFWSPNSLKPLDTALRTNNLTNLRIEITWNAFTNVNSAATAYSVNPQLTVLGYYDDSAFLPPLLKKIVRTTSTPTAAQTDFRVDLPVTPQYRSFLINTQVSGLDDQACIGNIQLVSGSTIFLDLPEPVLRQCYNIKSGIPGYLLNLPSAPATVQTTSSVTGSIPLVPTASQTTPAQAMFEINGKIAAGSDADAWYNLELCPDGYLTEAINTAGLPEFFFRFNVLKACTINISSTQLFPLATGQ